MVKFVYNPFTDNLDAIRSITELNAEYFRLDATNSPITGNTTIQGADFNVTSPSTIWTMANAPITYDGHDYSLAPVMETDVAAYYPNEDGDDLHFLSPLVGGSTDITDSSSPPDGIEDITCLLINFLADFGGGSATYYATIYLKPSQVASFTTYFNDEFGAGNWAIDAQSNTLTANGASTSYTFAGYPSGWTVLTDAPDLTGVNPALFEIDVTAETMSVELNSTFEGQSIFNKSVQFNDDIGIAADTDLIQLSNELVTVNGGITATGDGIIQGNTTLNTGLTGFAKLNSGAVSAQTHIDLTSEVSGILPLANGGTGLDTEPTNGQVLMGANSAWTVNTLTNGTAINIVEGVGSITINNTGVTRIDGTSNQINTTGATGNITLSTPQDIATNSNVTFQNITGNGVLNMGTQGTRASILGNTATFTGNAGDKIKVTINETIYDDIDISSATSIANVATAICSAVTDWTEISFADGGTGYLLVRSPFFGTLSYVSITDGSAGNGGETLRLFAANPTSDTGTDPSGTHYLNGALVAGYGKFFGAKALDMSGSLDNDNDFGVFAEFGTETDAANPTGFRMVLDKGYTGAGFSRCFWFINKTQGTGLNYGATGSAVGVTTGTNVGSEGLARNSITNYRNIAMWAHGGLFKASEGIAEDPSHLDTDSNAGDGFFGRDLEIKRNLHIDGDQVFYGGGLPFAQIYEEGGSTTMALAAQDTFYQVVVFSVDGESNNATPDHTNDHITIVKAGKYLVNLDVSFSQTTAVSIEYDFHVKKNNGAVDFSCISAHRDTAGGNTVGATNGTGIIDLSVGDTVEVWVERLTGGAVNRTITIPQISLTLTQIGG